MKEYIIYSDGSTIRLGKVKAKNKQSAENKANC